LLVGARLGRRIALGAQKLQHRQLYFERVRQLNETVRLDNEVLNHLFNSGAAQLIHEDHIASPEVFTR
jgi:hypothetical protein